MKKVLAFIATVGAFAAGLGSTACILVFADEPECPKALIK